MTPEELMMMMLDLSENPDDYSAEFVSPQSLEWRTPNEGTAMEKLSRFFLGVDKPSDLQGFELSEVLGAFEGAPPTPLTAGAFGIPRAIQRGKDLAGAIRDGNARVRMSFDPEVQRRLVKMYGSKAAEKGSEIAAQMFPRRIRNLDWKLTNPEALLLLDAADAIKENRNRGETR